MKVTVVPAQVTTVEDRIMGSLSFSQMMFIITPIFVSAGLFAILPPVMGGSAYKYIVLMSISVLSALLAVRIKGKILAHWLLTILRYNLRPRYYLFNKNVSTLRNEYLQAQAPTPELDIDQVATSRRSNIPKLTLPETAKVLAAINNPAIKLRFETTRKGRLNVRYTEIEE